MDINRKWGWELLKKGPNMISHITNGGDVSGFKIKVLKRTLGRGLRRAKHAIGLKRGMHRQRLAKHFVDVDILAVQSGISI